jgi:hypothetical protein
VDIEQSNELVRALAGMAERSYGWNGVVIETKRSWRS